MKQEQIHIRVSEVEKAQLLKLAGNEKLSRYLLRRALEAPADELNFTEKEWSALIDVTRETLRGN